MLAHTESYFFHAAPRWSCSLQSSSPQPWFPHSAPSDLQQQLANTGWNCVSAELIILATFQYNTGKNVVSDWTEKHCCDHVLKAECQKAQKLLKETEDNFKVLKPQSNLLSYVWFIQCWKMLLYFQQAVAQIQHAVVFSENALCAWKIQNSASLNISFC